MQSDSVRFLFRYYFLKAILSLDLYDCKRSLRDIWKRKFPDKKT